MFKNALNSLNGVPTERELQSAQEDAVSIDSETTVSGKQQQEGRISKSMKMISVKRGRKKLSSMMSRFSSSFGTPPANGAPLSRQTGVDSARCSDAEDSDDYKSAEEACRKLSLSDRTHRARNQRKSSSSGTAAPLTKDDEPEVYKQLKADKKYILPEEQCDIPTFLETKNCPTHLIEETRKLLKERYTKNPDNFYDADYERMLTDNWTVSRFLLRRRLDPKRTAKLMEECGRFRKQYKMSEVQLWEFPKEFHQAGGLFRYAPDRVGNFTMYMRVKMYRRVPEISDVFKAFILCVLEQCDVANNGRGTAVVFDLSACGLQNVDLGFLSWLLSSFRNYCPKGVSYIIVYNLPWILNATCKLAMTWMSASNKRALRFVYGDEIENFIDKSNLPDYLGGTCKLNYRAIPEGSRPAIEVCDRLDMTREQAIKIRELFKEYLNDDNDDHDENADGQCGHENQLKERGAGASASGGAGTTAATNKLTGHDETKSSHYDDGKASASLDETLELVTQASKFIAH